jgi:branched-chain amino acid aminotransferase
VRRHDRSPLLVALLPDLTLLTLVFDGLRLRAGRLFRTTDHLQRLRQSAHGLGIEVAQDDAELLHGIASVADVNGLADAHVRLIVTRGTGTPGLDPRRAERPSTWILAYPFPPMLGTEPLRMITSSVARKSPRSIPPTAKTLNYLDGVLAKLQANVAGADDALMLDERGLVAEATAANVCCVTGGRLRTPICTSALPGSTRRTVLELAGRLRIDAAEAALTTGDLYGADEAFITGTASGIVPIGSLDGRRLRAAPGTLTTTLTRAYAETWTDPRYSTSLTTGNHHQGGPR